jgi:hypothetical protein
MEVLDQLLIRSGFFQSVEIFAMEVFNQRSLQAGDIICRLNHGRDGLESRSASSSASPLTSNQLESILRLPDQHRLDHANTFDRVNE